MSKYRADRTIPTKRSIFVLAALAILAAVVPLLPGLEYVFWSLLCLFVLLFLEDWALRPKSEYVVAARNVSEVQFVGRAGSYECRVENHGTRALRVELGLGLPAGLAGEPRIESWILAPGASRTVRHEFVAAERGTHTLPALGLRIESLLGLAALQSRRALPEAIRVAPGRPSGEMQLLLRHAAVLEEQGERSIRRLGQDMEFDSMREYVPGDEVRRVDWKASSRRHRPMTRVHRAERNTSCVLALDMGRLMAGLVQGIRKLDLAMTPMLDLAAVALQRGERVGLLAFDSAPRIWIPPRGGFAQLGRLVEALADADVRESPTSYRRGVAKLRSVQRRRSTIVLFSDFTDEFTATEVMESIALLSSRHQVLFAAISDPQLRDVANAEAVSEDAVFQAGIAAQLLAERRRTLKKLQRLGVHAMDLDPRQATGPVLRAFLGRHSQFART